MSTLTSYTTVGQKEDVSDILSSISPFDTPMQAMCKNEKISARTFSFLEDSLAAAGVNAAVEGARATMIALDAQVERTNTTQILTKGFQDQRYSRRCCHIWKKNRNCTESREEVEGDQTRL